MLVLMVKSSVTANILAILVLLAILALSAFLTQRFTNAMYNRCPECGSLNAKRRTHCRICGHPFLI